MDKDISVIIPYYKGNKYIPKIIEMINKNVSLLQNKTVELIIVNDSPELPIDFNKQACQGYSVKLITNQKNQGIHRTRVNGLEHSEGKYVLFLDQDDEISDDALLTQLNSIGDSDAVIGNGYYEDSEMNKIALYKNKKQLGFVNRVSFYFYFGNVIASPGLSLIKKNAIPNLWKTTFMKTNGADDWLLWVSFLLDGKSFALNSKKIYVHKNVGHNTSDDDNLMLNSSSEGLDILIKSYKVPSYLISAYRNRLKMRRQIVEGASISNKLFRYFLHPMHSWYLIRIKLGI